MQTDRSIADLTGELAANAGELFRNELRLARAEAVGLVMPMWGAALIGAAIGGAIAYWLVRSGLKAISVERIALPRTAEQVARDLRSIKEKVSP
jgi:uncharacterized membrane protein YraQ (UPF0718 family)